MIKNGINLNSPKIHGNHYFRSKKKIQGNHSAISTMMKAISRQFTRVANISQPQIQTLGPIRRSE
mgnify:CR=1 FL=1